MKNQAFFRIRALAILFALLASGLFLVPATGWANNVTVTNVNYLDASDEVEFDVSWDNSWRNTGTPGSSVNYDGVWVFAKFRHACADDSLNPSGFQHMWLSQTYSAHTIPAGDSLKVGTTTISGTARGMGLFLYRATDGTGTHTLTGVKLKWDKSAQGIGPLEVDWDVRVYAIEMVYVPSAPFWVGDGNSTYRFKDGSTNNPLKISSEAILNMGAAAGYLNQPTSDLSGSLPAAYPKGYGSFWCMKYEITQDQYVSFLNSLSRLYQKAYVYTSLPPGLMVTTSPWVMYFSTGSATQYYRNGIRCPLTFHSTKPITFYNDLNQNNIPNETNDGQTLSMNYLYLFQKNFLDWAALRPMTELEFEKVCRGPAYAYGGTINSETVYSLTGSGSGNVNYVSNVNNNGAYNEIPTNIGAAGLTHAYYAGGNGPNGPRRVGSTHTGSTDRIMAGAAYYGAADMGGNLWEWVMPITTTTFVRTDLGDGNVITTNPSTWTTGYYRGGSFYDDIPYCYISNRGACYQLWTTTFNTGADYYCRLGARGVR